MQVQLAQIAPQLGVWDANLERHVELIEAASAGGVQVLVFPELSLTGYQLKDLVGDVAVTRQELERLLAARSVQARNLEVMLGFVEEGAGIRFYNSVAVLEWNERGVVHLRHCHRKVYLPTYGLFDEQRYFTAGRTIRAWTSRFLGRAGALICEDAWHLSVPYVLSADGPEQVGAQALVLLANSPARGLTPTAEGVPDSLQVWRHLNQTYATLLGCVVINCHRAGVEDGLIFSGGSEVVAPSGEVLGRAPLLEEAVLTVEYDSHELLRRHRVRNPVGAVENLDLTIRELRRVGDRP
jgi:predicted amidohydrolase